MSSVISSGASAPVAEAQCCVDLFGGLRVRHGLRTLTRFRTHKTAALLAYLAYHNDRMHSREVLVEMLWPDAGSQVAGRTSLSVALSSLRSQLEPPEIPAQSLLIADRSAVGLSPLVSTDAAAFEQLIRKAERARVAGDGDQERRLFSEAIPLYRDVLLPGHYDAWILPQQERLSDVFRLSVRRLAALHEQVGDLAAAVLCARRAVQADPLDEATGRELIRLLLQEGATDSGATDSGVSGALRQYQRLETALSETGEMPSAETRALIAPFKGGAFAVAPAMPRQHRRSGASGASGGPASFSDTPPLSPPPPLPEPHDRISADAPPSGEPPPRAPVQARTSNPLPHSLTRFYGRQAELAQLSALLGDGSGPASDSARLVTLTGPGGSGKTRLALEAARDLRRRSSTAGSPAAEVHFVSLQDVDTRPMLIGALCAALGVSEGGEGAGANPMASIVRALDGRPVLLVLDNLEQMADVAAPVVARLLERLPDLTCLVTSRVRLPVPGEREVPVRPLPVLAPPKSADDAEGWDLAALLREHPAIALFVDRAQLARPDFQITRRNAAAVVALTHRLEGIPLALELAAARSQVLTPRQMLERLEASSGSSRFELLVSHRKVVGGRHYSLLEALNLSYELLSPQLRRSLALLSIFRGGWNVEAAEAVTGSPVTLDDLAQLCDASLLRNEETDDGELRFFMLETIREFARELLLRGEFGEDARGAVEDRHRSYFAAMAASAARGSTSAIEQQKWIARLEVENDNCRAALRRVLRREPGDTSTADGDALCLIAGLQHLWLMRGRFTEGRGWGREFYARWRSRKDRARMRDDVWPTLDPELAGRAMNADGVLAMMQGDHAMAMRTYRQALLLRTRYGDASAVTAVLQNMAMDLAARGDVVQARALYNDCLERWRAIGNRRNAARCLGSLGVLMSDQGDWAAVASYSRDATAEALAVKDNRSASIYTNNLGIAELHLGNTDVADHLACEGLLLSISSKADALSAAGILTLGIVRCSKGDPISGPQLIRVALECHEELGMPIPEYAPVWIGRFPAAAGPAHGFSGKGLDALHVILSRWLPEHGV
jgi:predicted ATPase/DNA-binding SARP family transcriptional activator